MGYHQTGIKKKGMKRSSPQNLHHAAELAACITNKLAPTPVATTAAPTCPSVFGTELFIVEPATALNVLASSAKDSTAILLDRPVSTMSVLPPAEAISDTSSLASVTTVCRGWGVVSVVKVMLSIFSAEEGELYSCQMMLSAVSEARRVSVVWWP